MEKAQPTKRVLLIDDDPVSNMINTKIITMYFNYKVSAFTNAREALNQFSQWLNSSPDPGIIFLDINMPLMNGWEFLNEFEKLPEDLRSRCTLYMLSSSIDDTDVAKAKTYSSVKEFITKPITFDKLESVASESTVKVIKLNNQLDCDHNNLPKSRCN